MAAPEFGEALVGFALAALLAQRGDALQPELGGLGLLLWLGRTQRA
jgi:hypothetical protein